MDKIYFSNYNFFRREANSYKNDEEGKYKVIRSNTHLCDCKQLRTGYEILDIALSEIVAELIYCPACYAQLPDESPCSPVVKIKKGEEKYEVFKTTVFRKPRRMYQYDYCTESGERFTCVQPTLAKCRAARDKWLSQKINKIKMSTMDLEKEKLVIKDNCDTLEVWIDPKSHPETFRRKVLCLMLNGLSQEDAEREARNTPIKMELLYDIAVGFFMVESEAVDSVDIYNPYTGELIPKMNE